MDNFVKDIWYFAGLLNDIGDGESKAFLLANEPIVLAREGKRIFALRDICPHRAAPFSAGCVKSGTVECPYHGWRFGLADGQCKEIPALTDDSKMEVNRINVQTYPVQQRGPLVWIYLRSNPADTRPPTIAPPNIPLPRNRATLDDSVDLDCHIDNAAITLIDPAHGAYVHRQWWWRSGASIHEKSKAFGPTDRGFSMLPHEPSSNSFAYKLLGGNPLTEIIFQLPAVRTEDITIGNRRILAFTALTPLDENRTAMRQIFFTDHKAFRILSPLAGYLVRIFLRQDAQMIALQKPGLKRQPRMIFGEDADLQAKWYFALKKAWATAHQSGEAFINPVKDRILRWRS